MFPNFPFIIIAFLLMLLLICKDSLFAMLYILNPTRILLRRRKIQAKKGEYIMPKLNQIWLINSYNKLLPFKIKIYAYINAYLQNIIWVYVKISNRISYLILQQYLIIYARLSYCLMFFRVNRGSKLPLIAKAYFAFSRLVDPSIIQVKDYFISGKSTQNKRIESQQNKLEKSQLYRWRVS